MLARFNNLSMRLQEITESSAQEPMRVAVPKTAAILVGYHCDTSDVKERCFTCSLAYNLCYGGKCNFLV